MSSVTIDITFQKDPGGTNSYEVTAQLKRTPKGKGEAASEKISIDFEEWKDLASALKALDARVRGMKEEIKVKKFGKSLFEQVMKGQAYTLYKKGKDLASNRGSALRLRLHLGLPELIELPWEVLCEEGIYLVNSQRPPILVIRCPTNIQPIKAVEYQRPLQITIMAAEPTDVCSVR